MLRLNGRGLRQDSEDAVHWFYKSVLQKNIQACCTLGDIYFYGRCNIKKNTKHGSTLLEFASKNGSIDAQKEIENIYKEE
jgi:TPR repeat protein